MLDPEKQQIIKKIRCFEKKGKKIPCYLLCELAKSKNQLTIQPPFGTTSIIGPYLHLTTDILYPVGGQSLFKDFSFNIQYYNQGDYYTTYPHLFTDLTGGPYGQTQASSVDAIQAYFKSAYGTVPDIVKNSVVVGKTITPEAGANGYVDLGTLGQWFQQAKTQKISYGGYMLWSAGYFNTTYPSNKLVSQTFNVDVPHKVMYIGAGQTGKVWLADGSESVYAQGSDPDGSNARKVLTSYVNAGFNELLLSFWNYDVVNNKAILSDWVIDWSSIAKDSQIKLVNDLKAKNPNVKIIVSAGGAYGAVPNSDPTKWATELANFAIANNLDGIDLDLESGLLGTVWSEEQYNWVKTVVQTIASIKKDWILSFAPVGPLMANPN